MGTHAPGRFPDVYDDCMNSFESLLDYVDDTLGLPRARLALPVTYPSVARDVDWLLARYATVSVETGTSLHSAWEALHSVFVLVSDPNHEEPRFQVVTLADLPAELVAMVVDYAASASVVSLSGVARRYRAICLPDVMKSARFVLRADHGLLRRHKHVDRDFLCDVDEAMLDASLECERVMYDFLSEDIYPDRVRKLYFVNEWEEHFSGDETWQLPSPMTHSTFGHIYDAIESMLHATRPEYVSFRSLGLTPRTVTAISHATLHTLSVENCFPCMFWYTAYDTPVPNVVCLELGFGLSPHDDAQVRDMWTIMSYCTQLRHLHVYALDAYTAVRWPLANYSELTIIHQLETLHLHGMAASVSCFHSWVEHAMSVHRGQPSRLSSVKLHTAAGMDDTQLAWVLKTVTLLAESLRVLVLDGIHHIPSRLLRDISSSAPLLEGLSVFRRTGRLTRRTTLCSWEEPVYAYAAALSCAARLQHFEANFLWTRYSYSPASLLALLHVDADTSPVSVDFFAPAAGLHNRTQPVAGNLDDAMEDGRSMALPFVALCTQLQSFAITTDVTFFSCSVCRSPGGLYSLEDIRHDVHTQSDDRWNPVGGRTWRQA